MGKNSEIMECLVRIWQNTRVPHRIKGTGQKLWGPSRGVQIEQRLKPFRSQLKNADNYCRVWTGDLPARAGLPHLISWLGCNRSAPR